MHSLVDADFVVHSRGKRFFFAFWGAILACAPAVFWYGAEVVQHTDFFLAHITRHVFATADHEPFKVKLISDSERAVFFEYSSGQCSEEAAGCPQ